LSNPITFFGQRSASQLLSLSNATHSLSQPQSVGYLWQAAIDQTSDLILTIDIDLKFTILNRAAREEAQKIFGTKIQIGMSIIEASSNRPETQLQVLTI
jgi:hypothetical protein